MSKGKLILIMGPSGSGKGTLISMLKNRRKDFFYPVSATTRLPREGEKDGETYFFISEKEFKNKIENGDFLEYACVHSGAYYGMLKKPVLDAINLGKTVIREIDVQGFNSVKNTIDKSVLFSIFILPPDEKILIRRIKERSTISNDELLHRLDSIEKELEYIKYADFSIQNIDYGEEDMYKDLIEKIELINNKKK